MADRGRFHVPVTAPQPLAPRDKGSPERERAQNAHGRRQQPALDTVLHHEQPAQHQRQRGDCQRPVRAQPGPEPCDVFSAQHIGPGRRGDGFRAGRWRRLFGHALCRFLPGQGQRWLFLWRRRGFWRGGPVGLRGCGSDAGDLGFEPGDPVLQAALSKQQDGQPDQDHQPIKDAQKTQ